MLLTAGPGTGKTLTLTHRVAYLVATTKVSPRRMLVLTHTPQSALKLEARLHQLLHGPLGIRVCTLFEFCRDLQEDEELVGDEQHKPPRLLSEMESATLLQELAALRAPNLTDTELHRIYRQIAWAKQQLLFPDECATRAMTKTSENTPLDTFLATTHRFFLPLYQDYQNMLRQEHLIDLEDLLIDTAQRLLQDASYRTAVQEKYHSIHVDDYQELGHAAQIILQQLTLENTDFCAFSDPDQAIYQSSPGVRHSVKAFIQSFSTPTQKAMSCGLWRNYRTPETYLEAAEYVIQAQAHPKRIKPLAMVSGGEPIQVVVNQHDREEAIWVTELIRSLHNQPTEPGTQHAIQFEDIAILYRQNEQRPLLIQALKDASIPFRTHHPSSDIRSRPYAALAACWQCINVGLNDWLSFRLLVSVCKDLGTSVWPHLRARLHTASSLTAVLLEEEDKQLLLPSERDILLSLRDTIDTLSQTVKQSHIERTSAAQVMAQLIDTITPFLRKDAQLTKEQRDQLIEQATAAGSLHQWHRTLVLSRYATPPTNQQEHVALLPIQAAKGLEYKVIIVVGCEAEWMPGQVATEKQREREDRLVYVALTRARHKLFLSRARLRTIQGKKTSTTPAPFLERCAPYLQMTTPGQWKQERNDPPAQRSFLEELDT
jgi:DNA helicase-2/ATP-dependent DNA helicase PcrA